jgi:hypothetical protein
VNTDRRQRYVLQFLLITGRTIRTVKDRACCAQQFATTLDEFDATFRRTRLVYSEPTRNSGFARNTASHRQSLKIPGFVFQPPRLDTCATYSSAFRRFLSRASRPKYVLLCTSARFIPSMPPSILYIIFSVMLDRVNRETLTGLIPLWRRGFMLQKFGNNAEKTFRILSHRRMAKFCELHKFRAAY